jgi:hypothetical protein
MNNKTLYDKDNNFLVASWIQPIMKEHAILVSLNGGDILEFGFGLGIFSEEIQKIGVKSHTIVENDPEIFKDLVEFAKKYDNVIPVFDSWLNFESKIQYDGIFFDTNTSFDLFGSYVQKWSKEGTIISWFSPAKKEQAILNEFADRFIEIPINMEEYSIYDSSYRDTYYLPLKIYK